MALWTPTSLANVSLLLDVEDKATLTLVNGGQNVDAWASKVGPIVARGPGQPEYKATNGVFAIYGNNNYRRFETNLNLGGLPAGNAPSTMIFVGRSTASNIATFTQVSGAQSERGIGAGDNMTITSIVNGNDLRTSTPFGLKGNIVTATWDGLSPTTNTLYADGVLLGQYKRGNAIATANEALRIFANEDETKSEFIYAGIIVNRVLTTDERQKVEGWAAWRFNLVANLPAGHPYKSAAPETVEAKTFLVGARPLAQRYVGANKASRYVGKSMEWASG